MSARKPLQPLVAIVGATGTGKSQLAVELALRFNGEIINGDAMQLYEGLPVITNKVTTEECKGVPHHLLGCIGLEEPTWTVGRFVNKALGIIDEIRSRGRLPILVGGTHYYTQSLLFRESLADDDDKDADFLNSEERDQKWPIMQESTEVILEKLKEVDPVMADRWHPKDRRKIQRSLEIWLKTGKTASQTYEEQQQIRNGQAPGEGDESTTNIDGLRCPTLLLWVHCDPDTLRTRLDARVDVMVRNGLLDEVKSLHTFLQQQNNNGQQVDRSRGIWVSIGYKEFEEYQSAVESGSKSDKRLEELKEAAIERTKAATRQYAKRQVRWIRIKLIHALRSQGAGDSMFVLDGSDLGSWHQDVEVQALELAQVFLAGEAMLDPATLSDVSALLLEPKREYDMSQRRDLWERRVCEPCNTVLVTESDWNQHIKSKGHKFALRSAQQRNFINSANNQGTG
ncbi:tRNA isopentenyltransferas-like protein [Rhizodiscina lignyota]|uniref:tRNA dimethylallyltransferase n=1 Tax=Rhizodiscina lignyota TaxID=1504668 RepID=A0A9P4IJF2_9PEZI|nr:tRNA isopentenyltransferas-like protein [Rhizodiscina lignyota]